jgi:hypothetical protein
MALDSFFPLIITMITNFVKATVAIYFSERKVFAQNQVDSTETFPILVSHSL